MKTHIIHYDGVDYQVIGEWDKPEEETGYRGGFSWMQIKINDMDVSSHLKEWVINKLVEMVVEQNY